LTHVRLALAALVVFFAAPAVAFEDAARPEAMIAALVQGSPTAQGRIHLEPEYPIRLRGASLAGVSAPLVAKARELAQACGAVVISGHRHTRVAGSRRLSLHASGRAIDVRGNPGCVYAHLRGWPGGYTTDYGRVRHVHISLGGREDGLRFVHGGHRHHHVRYARI
jgi:hypothetical protein